MAQERDRLRERIRAEARAGDWWSLWPAFVRSRATLLERLAVFAGAEAAWRPGAGEGESAWSAAEVARHVLAYSRNVGAIIEATAAGRTEPKDPPGTLIEPTAMPFDETVRAVTRASVTLASLPERLPAAPNLETTVPHAFFGPLNCREWYVFLWLHDTDHAAQLERLRELPGFPRASPR